MSNARREQQQKARVSAIAAAATTGDDDAKRKAVMNVVQVWLDRLQLISTIVRICALTSMCATCLSYVRVRFDADNLLCWNRRHDIVLCDQPHPCHLHSGGRVVDNSEGAHGESGGLLDIPYMRR
jgi:hypothetical protein